MKKPILIFMLCFVFNSILAFVSGCVFADCERKTYEATIQKQTNNLYQGPINKSLDLTGAGSKTLGNSNAYRAGTPARWAAVQ